MSVTNEKSTIECTLDRAIEGVILGSATPTLESYARALKGVYKLLILDKRIGNSVLPNVDIIDMADEVRTRNFIIVDESPKFANVKIKITSDQNDIINNSKMTLAIEKERKKFVDNLKDNIFVYDRSIFSFLAISFAYYKFGIIDYFEEYLYHIIEGLKKDEFSIPDYLIYLKIDNKTAEIVSCDKPLFSRWSKVMEKVSKALAIFANSHDIKKYSFGISGFTDKGALALDEIIQKVKADTVAQRFIFKKVIR